MDTVLPLFCCLPRIPFGIGPRGWVGGVYPGRTLCRQRHHQTGWMYLPREARLSLKQQRTNMSFPQDTCLCMLQEFMYIFSIFLL